MKAVDYHAYCHPLDVETLENLKQIPGFTPLLKGFMKIYSERTMQLLNMSNKIRLGPEQLPDIYSLLPPICEVLGIDEPEFYLELNPAPNAYTTGDTTIAVTITSGLLDYMTNDEIKAVIAHECGHIACHHVLYHTMAQFILNGGAAILKLGTLITYPLQLALLHWVRCSEFSADRAAAIYMRQSEPIVTTMMRLAGGGKTLAEQVNRDLYLKQAVDFKELADKNLWNKILQLLALMENDHPFLSVRASEIDKWCTDKRYLDIIAHINDENTEETSCPNCGAKIEENWVFCKRCGWKLQ